MSKRKDLAAGLDNVFNKMSGKDDPQPESKGETKAPGRTGRPPSLNKKDRFTTVIDPDKRDKLKRIGIREGLNVSDLIDKAIGDYIREYERKHGPMEP